MGSCYGTCLAVASKSTTEDGLSLQQKDGERAIAAAFDELSPRMTQKLKMYQVISNISDIDLTDHRTSINLMVASMGCVIGSAGRVRQSPSPAIRWFQHLKTFVGELRLSSEPGTGPDSG